MQFPPFARARRAAALTAVMTGLCAPLVHAADPMTSSTGGKIDGSDRRFIEKAALGGMAEVEMGKLAQDKAADPAVKAFGARMVTDHTKANADLQKVATAKGVTVPGTLDRSHKGDVDKLAKKSGADFDKAYMKGMVSDHKTDISDFEKEARSGKDADLKSFATSTLPTLQEHLKMAQTTNDALK